MIAVGAILTFAVDVKTDGLHLHLIGLILMAVGFIGMAAYVSVLKRRRTRAPAPAAPVVEEQRYYD
ncbi:hypothetical protein SPAR_13730 [Streptomyces sparsogenes DSM 40356]|uniref:Uncharacterized protein n=2 Tax=Streptomyces TaxID=1883 RepID=A0A1R1SLK3_9ACTN|nr:hypothetical protein SPAR_13730 [Streptomyces sparsogenes DSM 40356]